MLLIGYCNSETSNTSDRQTYEVVSSTDDLFEDVTATLDLLSSNSFASDIRVTQTVINLFISSSSFVDTMISPTDSINDHIMSPTDVTSFISTMSSSNLIFPTTSYFDESSIVQGSMSPISSFVSFSFNPSSTLSITETSIFMMTNIPGISYSSFSSVHITPMASDISSFSSFISSTPSPSLLSSERLSTTEAILISSESLVVLPSPSQVSDSSAITISSYNSFSVSSLSSRVLLSSSTLVFSSIVVHSSNIASSSVGYISSLISSYSMPVSPTVTPIDLVPVVNIESINATSILISWSSVADAIGYIILIRQENILVKREANLRITIDVSLFQYL